MPEPYVLAPGGADVFRTFVIPIPLSAGRYVAALEFRPGNPRVVHHANLGIDRTRSSRYLDRRDDEPGYAGGMVAEAGYPEGYMLGYTPGQVPHAEPDGMAWRLETNSDLVVQLHMQPGENQNRSRSASDSILPTRDRCERRWGCVSEAKQLTSLRASGIT